MAAFPPFQFDLPEHKLQSQAPSLLFKKLNCPFQESPSPSHQHSKYGKGKRKNRCRAGQKPGFGGHFSLLSFHPSLKMSENNVNVSYLKTCSPFKKKAQLSGQIMELKEVQNPQYLHSDLFVTLGVCSQQFIQHMATLGSTHTDSATQTCVLIIDSTFFLCYASKR